MNLIVFNMLSTVSREKCCLAPDQVGRRPFRHRARSMAGPRQRSLEVNPSRSMSTAPNTRRLSAHAADLEDARAILRAGGLVAFPTETVYGLGADAGNPQAVARL